jgi:hypothetical protein
MHVWQEAARYGKLFVPRLHTRTRNTDQHEVSGIVLAQVLADRLQALVPNVVPEQIDLFQAFIGCHDSRDGACALCAYAIIAQVEFLQGGIVLSFLGCERLCQGLQNPWSSISRISLCSISISIPRIGYELGAWQMVDTYLSTGFMDVVVCQVQSLQSTCLLDGCG